MDRSPGIERRIFSLLRTRTVKKRTIIIGLKSDTCSREMLLRLLSLVVTPGDNVLAVHVQEPNDTFDPNTFHMHEDLCRSKQVDFQVKVCIGNSYISELTHQVRVNFATMLALGCSTSRPKDSVVASCLKGLPPTCSLLVMDNGGRILIQRQGTSQQGSTSKVFQSSLSDLSKYTYFDQSGTTHHLQKSSTMPSPSTSSTMQQDDMELQSVKKTMQGTSQQGSGSKIFQSSLSDSSKYTYFDQSGTTRHLQKLSTMPYPSTSSSTQQDDMGLQSFKKTMQGTSQKGSASKVFQFSLSDSSKYTYYDQSGTTRHLQKLSTMPSPSTSSSMQQDDMGLQSFKKTMQGTSQKGSASKVFQFSLSDSSKYTYFDQSGTTRHLQKSSTMPSPATSSSMGQDKMGLQSVKKTMQLPDFLAQEPFQRLALLEEKGSRHFRSQELNSATNNFSPAMVIGEGGHSTVYRANLEDGRAAAVKVLKTTCSSTEDHLQEVELLSGLKHENIVQIIGYCYSKEMHAIVYNLQKESLKQTLRQLRWSERMGVAIGVAKALEYLHHSCNPPIIHRDVKSSNILLSDNCLPQLSDFGAAMVQHQPQEAATITKPFHVIGTFGYLAPEYVMYGKVDEKIDVYSYGVVLLELITGKEAILTNQASNQESLVLWARSLLSCGLCERLIDPCLNEDYNKEELKTMMMAARLCLLHSCSRRPTMKTILRLFEEPEYWLNKQREREEFLNGISSRDETGLWRHDDSDTDEMLVMDDL